MVSLKEKITRCLNKVAVAVVDESITSVHHIPNVVGVGNENVLDEFTISTPSLTNEFELAKPNALLTFGANEIQIGPTN